MKLFVQSSKFSDISNKIKLSTQKGKKFIVAKNHNIYPNTIIILLLSEVISETW